MRRNVRRLLSLLLCAVMLCGLLPGMTAFAAEVETAEEPTAAETIPAQTEETQAAETAEEETASAETTAEETQAQETQTEETVPEETVAEETQVTVSEEAELLLTIGTDEYGNTTFTSFADLQALAAETYSTFTDVTYVGEGPLEITADLTIPEYLGVYVDAITVEEGTTLTVNGDLYISQALTVNGTLNDNGYISLDCDTVVIGDENITYCYEWQSLCWWCEIADMEDLRSAVDMANSNSAKTRWQYDLNVASGVELIVTNSVTIPGNCGLRIQYNAAMTIAEGSTLQLEALYVWSGGPLTIAGTLVNNCMLSVNYDGGGKVTLTESGTYSGTGELNIFSETLTAPDAALENFDQSKYRIVERNDGSHYWTVTNIDGLTQLGTPTDLQWGISYEWVWSSEAQEMQYVAVEMPGAISWKPVEPDQAQGAINVYRVMDDGTAEFTNGYSWYFGSGDLPQWRSIDSFILSDPESGSYYFTVTSIGDNTEYYNSETATSDTWTYTKPNTKLGSCSNLSWNWPQVSFDAPEDTTNVGGYEVEFYLGATKTAMPSCIGSTWSRSGNTVFEIFDSYIQSNGDGYYYFKVRALSDDITAACNGDWSDFSPAFNLNQVAEDVKGELDTISSAGTAEAKVEAVQALDTEELRSAMLADEEVVQKLSQLEQDTVGAASVTVTEDASAFDVEKVSVVGANLNDKSAEGDITLVIDKPKAENVIPDAYDNSVAVSFSMGLDNAVDQEKLEVPVQITLPIPAEINPNFLVILHYAADGSVKEIIEPHITQKDGQYYATFVLTSFSDFIMTMKKDVTAGDFDGDGKVTDSDVAYLLWHTLFPESYPLKGNGDLNNDSKVDDSDVAYLLWHTLFPESYPL